MKAEVYWVLPDRLAILSRPRAGDWLEDEIRSLSTQGVQFLVTLLTPAEEVELGLSDEIVLAEKHGMEFMRYPIPDRGVPRSPELFAETIRDLADSGKPVGVHCRAGIGRSAIAAAGIMARLGHDLDDSLKLIGDTRGVRVPDTDEQRQWLTSHIHLFKA